MSADTVPVPQPPRWLDRVRHACRVRHYSLRTEDCYADGSKRFILFHGKRHPLQMGAAAINQFLTHLPLKGTLAPRRRTRRSVPCFFCIKRCWRSSRGRSLA
jgi:hypothetical protein